LMQASHWPSSGGFVSTSRPSTSPSLVRRSILLLAKCPIRRCHASHVLLLASAAACPPSGTFTFRECADNGYRRPFLCPIAITLPSLRRTNATFPLLNSAFTPASSKRLTDTRLWAHVGAYSTSSKRCVIFFPLTLQSNRTTPRARPSARVVGVLDLQHLHPRHPPSIAQQTRRGCCRCGKWYQE
jgi:hypothetical protein